MINITVEKLAAIKFNTSFTVFPSDSNYNDPACVFGGKMLAEMDSCAAIVCRRALYGTKCTDCVTVNVQVDFNRPAFIGDIVHIEGILKHVGHKSLVVSLFCKREEKRSGEIHGMANGEFTFVSRKNGVPCNHELVMIDEIEE